MKKCKHCGEPKATECYGRSNRHADGRLNVCKGCISSYRAAQRDRPGARERLRAVATQWNSKNADKLREQRLQRYKNNPQKFAERDRTYRKRNPEAKWRHHIHSKYGLTQSAYELLLASQNGGCAICGQAQKSKGKKRLIVDHNHETGMVRGLLCDKHNRAIGLFGDDPELLIKAAMYLVEREPSLCLKVA